MKFLNYFEQIRFYKCSELTNQKIFSILELLLELFDALILMIHLLLEFMNLLFDVGLFGRQLEMKLVE